MTYKELELIIHSMSEAQKNSDVTIYNEFDDEYFPMKAIAFEDEMMSDVLDAAHPYLTF